MKLFIIHLIFFNLVIFYLSLADEIIQDKNGNYFLMKDDGTFKKLPPPKPGNKYIMQKKMIQKDVENEIKIFKRSKKKARTRTNQGFS